MSIPSSDHPLLALVDANKNTLKCALVKYIDVTVENQFGQLRNRIVHMIESGEIVLNSSDHDQQSTSDTLPSLVNTITTSALIKQECHDSSSSTIPINADYNDEPNDDDNDPSIQVGISVNDGQNEQYPNDDIKEEYDDDDDYDDVDEEEGEYMSDCGGCEDCVNGIGGLVGENDDAHIDAHTGEDMDIGLGQNEIENEPNASLESDLMVISNVIDASNQSTENDLINECDQQIRTNQYAIKQNIENGQSVQPIEDNQQSIPSTSGLRSSGRKRIQRKLFGGDHQSSGQGKSDKRKSQSNSTSKAAKKMRKQNVEEFHQDDEEEGKLQVITLKVNCTEDSCKAFLNSVEMWKTHLSYVHGQMPYNHLQDNVRHNQHGQTEYACNECEAVCTSQRSLNQHWRMYHLAGKFECSICAFVGNLWCEVHNHYRKNHLRKTIQCTQEGCNQTFQFMNHLEIHQRVHSGETPYRCTWHNCELSFTQIATAIRHVRIKHFRLPRTVKKQKELNIIDERDPKVYIQV